MLREKDIKEGKKVRVIKHEGTLGHGYHYRFPFTSGIIKIVERKEETDEIIAINIEVTDITGKSVREWMPLEALAPFCRLNRCKK